MLAGAGLHHEQLVELASPMLSHLPAGQDAAAIEPASQYQGAHILLPGSAPHANLILAFEYPGGWRDIKVRVVNGQGVLLVTMNTALTCLRFGWLGVIGPTAPAAVASASHEQLAVSGCCVPLCHHDNTLTSANRIIGTLKRLVSIYVCSA